MPRFDAEPPYTHGTPGKSAVLLVNLGTPDAPTASAVRRYLKEFLSDPRVVEIPALVWQLILRGVILNVRPAKSAKKYASIWTPEGSPLLVNTVKQAKRLQGFLGHAGRTDLTVQHAMRYGNPSVASRLSELRAQGITRILVVPMYPQYAASTTASVFDAVAAWAKRSRNVPELRFVRNFHDDPAYVDAVAQRIAQHWEREGGKPDKLVMSFHGLPRYTLDKGDPYHCECQKTGRLVAEKLKLAESEYVVTFQSRFGKAEWLKPYTAATLEELGKAKTKRVDVVCPGFVADCLETLEEIADEGKETFQHAGGGAYHYIPCVNDGDGFMHALTALVQRHTHGWPTEQPDEAVRAAARARARAMGCPA
jgi:protoporphyrin/coproporphyrin ferrochelatase